MKMILLRLTLLVFGFLAAHSIAAIDVYQFETVKQEKRFRVLIDELRCPKCQNQNLSGSDAGIAKDLKSRVYSLINQGKSNAEIQAHLVERYGDFITYKPPFRMNTLLLWCGPLFIVLFGVVMAYRQGDKKQRSFRSNDNQLNEHQLDEALKKMGIGDELTSNTAGNSFAGKSTDKGEI